MTSKLRVGSTLSVVALLAAGCSAGDVSPSITSRSDGSLKGQSIEVAAVWSGTEQQRLQSVLDAFSQRTGAKVSFTSTGDDISTVLGSRISGGKPPDVAFLPQPGLLTDLANQDALKPLNAATENAVTHNYAGIWTTLGSYNGKLYGVWFKVANKSTIWYRPDAFADAGVEPPKTWDEFVNVSKTISDSGTTPLSIGGADGWTLTDWFENTYLRVAGSQRYDQLTKHQIPWTDPSVIQTLTLLGKLWGGENLMPGGGKGALQVNFPQSITNVFGDQPKAAIVYEGDFVAGVIGAETKARVGRDAKVFDFPSVNGSTPAVVGGGDVAVAMRDSKAGMALLEFLASPAAAEIWARQGGFLSANKEVDTASYPDDATRQFAEAIVKSGDSFRFDMSDLAPPAFGATAGSGEWRILQDFLAAPSDVHGTARKLEAAAVKAYGGQ